MGDWHSTHFQGETDSLPPPPPLRWPSPVLLKMQCLASLCSVSSLMLRNFSSQMLHLLLLLFEWAELPWPEADLLGEEPAPFDSPDDDVLGARGGSELPSEELVVLQIFDLESRAVEMPLARLASESIFNFEPLDKWPDLRCWVLWCCCSSCCE